MSVRVFLHLCAPALGCVCGHASPGSRRGLSGIDCRSRHCCGGTEKKNRKARTKTDPAKNSGVPPLPSQPGVVLFFIREFVSVAVATVGFVPPPFRQTGNEKGATCFPTAPFNHFLFETWNETVTPRPGTLSQGVCVLCDFSGREAEQRWGKLFSVKLHVCGD